LTSPKKAVSAVLNYFELRLIEEFQQSDSANFGNPMKTKVIKMKKNTEKSCN